jgi:hypothetical protein
MSVIVTDLTGYEILWLIVEMELTEFRIFTFNGVGVDALFVHIQVMTADLLYVTAPFFFEGTHILYSLI